MIIHAFTQGSELWQCHVNWHLLDVFHCAYFIHVNKYKVQVPLLVNCDCMFWQN